MATGSVQSHVPACCIFSRRWRTCLGASTFVSSYYPNLLATSLELWFRTFCPPGTHSIYQANKSISRVGLRQLPLEDCSFPRPWFAQPKLVAFVFSALLLAWSLIQLMWQMEHSHGSAWGMFPWRTAACQSPCVWTHKPSSWIGFKA